MKLNVGISSNGDVDVGEISLTEMDPEDIRVGTSSGYGMALTSVRVYVVCAGAVNMQIFVRKF